MEISSLRDRRVAAAAALVVVVAAGVAVYTFSAGTPTGQAVERAMELSTGNDLEVLSVENQGSLDRIVLRQQGSDRVTEVYATSDGQYIVSNPVDVANYTRQLEARSSFLSCLGGNATFYGIISQNANLTQYNQLAQLQVQALGGPVGIAPVFGGPGQGETVTVQGQQVPVNQLVLQNGVVWQIGDEVSTGIMTVDQLEDSTGCTYDASGGSPLS